MNKTEEIRLEMIYRNNKKHTIMITADEFNHIEQHGLSCFEWLRQRTQRVFDLRVFRHGKLTHLYKCCIND